MTTPAPAFARWLLGRFVAAEERELFLGDLDEEYALRLDETGRVTARLWYWRQVIHSVLPLARHRLVAPHPRASTSNGDPMWRDLLDDLRYSMRITSRNPIATVAVIGTMVLGIGATTAVFSVVNSVLLRPLPFDGSERVVRMGLILRDGRFSSSMPYPDVQDYKRDAHSFSDFCAGYLDGITLTEGDTPQQLLLASVDDAWSRVFSVRPAVGRFFSKDEYVHGAPKVVMLSYALWQKQFGKDRNVVGRTISLGNEPHTVVGVLPQMAYTWPWPALDLITPLIPEPGTYQINRGAGWLRVVGKMKPGVSFAQGQRDIATVAARLAKDYPDANGGLGTRIEPLHDVVVGDVRGMLVLMSASVAAVLLIACVNIANLLLGQSWTRGREFALRSALGGSGGRIRRQLLTESMFLAVVGGVIGTALAPLLTHLLIALYPGQLPRVGEIGVDFRVLFVGIGATIAAGVLAGIPMARRATALNLTRDLRDGARSISTAGQRRVSGILVVSQVAISLTLLFSAGLLLQTFRRLSHTDPGFATHQVESFQIYASPTRYHGAAETAGFYAAVESGLRALPGVQSVSTATEAAFNGNSNRDVFVVKERGDQGNANPQVRVAMVGPDYWATLGVPVISGRVFGASDDAQAPPVVMINSALAKQIYPGVNPVGHVIQWNHKEWEIIGVVGAMRMDNMVEPADAELYTATTQMTPRSRYVFVKSSQAPAQLIPQVRATLHHVDPTVAVVELETMDERLGTIVAPQRFRAALIGGLGVLALLLSTLGVYGVVAFAVNRQTREIGIRMALGEEQAHVQRRVIFSALRIVVAGAIIGTITALGVSRWLATFLVGVNPHDPTMLAATGGLLLIVAAGAAYFPARRASRVDPLVALRNE